MKLNILSRQQVMGENFGTFQIGKIMWRNQALLPILRREYYQFLANDVRLVKAQVENVIFLLILESPPLKSG